MPTSASTSRESRGPTEDLSHWVSSVTLDDVPQHIQVRAKHIILDGLACGFVGAHLPWSTKAADALLAMEPTVGGVASVFGWDGRKATAPTSALLNSTFIQGFELDDWHSEAPLHSNSIVLPAIFAAAQQVAAQSSSHSVSGRDVLLATIVGYEVGPRVGLALHGSHVLSSGWHSGAVFGPAASAASVGKLLGLDEGQTADAFGIACTQACGLMSAQFESEVKRMQHGFAARNGLNAACLAKGGYVGIKQVFERKYGGFLKQFTSGNGKSPQYLEDELTKELGTKWQTDSIRIKPYASMALTHPTIDCVRQLQDTHREQMHKIDDMVKITIELGEAAFHHGGWKTTYPLTSTGAQMSNSFIAATQICHGEITPARFGHATLEDKNVWRLVDVTQCQLSSDKDCPLGKQKVTIEFKDGTQLSQGVDAARGVDPPISNDEIVDKWTSLTDGIIDKETAEKIKQAVLSLDSQDDISTLCDLLGSSAKSCLT